MRPTDVLDTGLLRDLLWSDPGNDVQDRGENDLGVSFTLGADGVSKSLNKHDLELIFRAHQVVEDVREFFAKLQPEALGVAPRYCGEFRNARRRMSVNKTLMCAAQILRISEEEAKGTMTEQYGGCLWSNSESGTAKLMTMALGIPHALTSSCRLSNSAWVSFVRVLLVINFSRRNEGKNRKWNTTFHVLSFGVTFPVIAFQKKD